MFRRFSGLALLAAIGAVLVYWWGGTVLTTQTDEALRAQRPVRERCPGDHDAECAAIKVPLDHAAPEDRPIELALARLPARHPDQRIGSLVVNYGGPGVSGIDSLLADPELFIALRARYDIVAFDPRGVGKSSPLNCRPGGEPLPYLAIDQTPDTARELEILVKASDDYAAACKRQAGWLLPHLTTDATARDLDILRSALEEPELTFFGYSYGGGLGAAYAKLHPGKVRRMVLDAPSADPGGGPLIEHPAIVSDEPIRVFAADCVKRRGCPLGRKVRTGLTKIQTFVERLDRRPLPVSGHKLTDALAVEGLNELLRTTDDWPRLRRALAAAFEGDGRPLYDAAMDFQESQGFSRDAFTAISCADTSTRPRPGFIEEQAKIARERAPISGAWSAWSALMCQGWDTVKGTAWLTDPPRQLSPIMVVGTDGDPVVPYEVVKEVRSTLSGSVLVTLHGDGHTAYRTGVLCVNEAVEAYLLDGEVPTADVKCRAAGTGKR
ncbi:alpha/beta fold hydrolase [Nonomuraea rosea]|uniref:Alpha/beta fold hydrolase n=1 Tax=Nonomuraea rosea TaxID=638574 RepID=A0ABP6XJY0_9ACTN